MSEQRCIVTLKGLDIIEVKEQQGEIRIGIPLLPITMTDSIELKRFLNRIGLDTDKDFQAVLTSLNRIGIEKFLVGTIYNTTQG